MVREEWSLVADRERSRRYDFGLGSSRDLAVAIRGTCNRF
jgi:hypothetical protein